MSAIRVRLDRPGACEVTHTESGLAFHTDAPSEFGRGRAVILSD